MTVERFRVVIERVRVKREHPDLFGDTGRAFERVREEISAEPSPAGRRIDGEAPEQHRV